MRLFKEKKKALVADDDEGALDLFTFILHEEGWEVIEARSGEEIVSKAMNEQPSVLLLDNRMPDYSGAQAYEILRSMGFSAPAILVSGVDNARAVADAHGIKRCFQKPVDMPALLEAIEEAYRERR